MSTAETAPAASGRGLFITGTDTGVGKTLAAALLALRLRTAGRPCSYLKPMETGIADRQTLENEADGAKVKKAAALEEPLAAIIPYTFREPLAPLLAARREGRVVSRDELLATVTRHLEEHPFSLVEGAGGLLVPLAPGFLLLDLIREVRLPALVVCRSALGGVNHTLMTLRCLRQAGVPVAGLVVNHLTGRPGIAERHFIEQVAEFDPAPVIAELPHLPGINYTREELLPLCDRLHLERLAG
ncbi:MAG: dethiobiotin synthase [Deltaproteobacteria bacterium]|nr:dethiobiotin synthase [Deltaproteobacteria bacterium]